VAIQTQRDDSSMNYAALAIPTAVTAWFVGWKPTWIKTLRSVCNLCVGLSIRLLADEMSVTEPIPSTDVEGFNPYCVR